MEYRYSVKEWRIGEPKSKSGYRTIPLTEEAVAILNKQKEKNKWISEISKEWEEFVFLCRKGTPVKNSTYDTALFKICDKAQIPRFSMHILRHTFATRCIEAVSYTHLFLTVVSVAINSISLFTKRDR